MDNPNGKTDKREEMVLSPGASTEEAGSSQIDHVAEQKLIRKLDRHIIPIVMLLYVFSFLDRQVNRMDVSSMTVFSLMARKCQCWECETVWDGRRPWLERRPISDRFVAPLCNLLFVRDSKQSGSEKVHPFKMDCVHHNG